MKEFAQGRDRLPAWAEEMISLYESRSVNQFILHGNVNDRFYLPLGHKASLGGIRDFLLRVLLPGFELILSYDLGNGIRVEKGGEIFSQWTGAKESLEFRLLHALHRCFVFIDEAYQALCSTWI